MLTKLQLIHLILLYNLMGSETEYSEYIDSFYSPTVLWAIHTMAREKKWT